MAEAAAEATEASEGDEEALKRLEELVSSLYRFRDQLSQGPAPGNGDPGPGTGSDPGTGSGAKTGSEAALEEEMERTLRLMEEVQVSSSCRGRAWALRGRALEVTPGGAVRAEQALGRALKLNPGDPGAWSHLGELRWARGDRQGALSCFAAALRQGEHPEARRLLSMALRAEGGALRESLAQAEAAVRGDPQDGRNWYVLGNAYVSLFFGGGQSPDYARRALGAYAQAERVDPEASKNPDLHLNRATVLQYQERFGEALEGLGRAAILAPAWEEPRRRQTQLLDFLTRLCSLLANRGQARGKRRRGLEAPLPDWPPAPGWPRPSALPDLSEGPNPRRALLGRVLFSLCPQGGVPYAVGILVGGAVATVTIYNAAPNWGVLVGDLLGVLEPQLVRHQHQYQGKSFSFLGIRVQSPLSLLVNGRPPPAPALAPARLALTNCPSPPTP